jgi:hypothetical protein
MASPGSARNALTIAGRGTDRVAPSIRWTGERLVAVAERPRLVLGSLVLLQWLCVAAFALTTTRNGWLFYQGGDETFIYTTAWSLGDGELPRTNVGYFWSFVLAPITWIAGPNFVEAVPAIVLLQFLVLLPVALLAVYGIATSVGGRLIGYTAATLWVVLPYATIPLFVDRYHTTYEETFLPHALGLSGLADFPSTVAILVSAYFAFRALDGRDPTAAVLAGVFAGLATGIKPASGLFIAAPVVAFALARRFREGGAFLAGTLPCLLTLALWKHRGLGELPVLAFEQVRVAAAALPWPLAGVDTYVDIDWDRLREHREGFQEFFWSVRLIEWLPIAGFFAVARRSLPKAALLGVWLLAFFVVKGSNELATVSSASFFRLVMPAYPAFLILAASIPLLVPTFGPRLAERWRAGPPSGGRRLLPIVAVATVFVTVPLVASAALPAVDGVKVVKDHDFGLLVPIDPDFGVAASTSDGAVSLSWPALPAGSSRVQYRVYRREPTHPAETAALPDGVEGIRCKPVSGAAECALEMTVLGTTEGTAWVDRPPPGRWTYRVGLLAGWQGSADTADLMVLSRPVTVDASER